MTPCTNNPLCIEGKENEPLMKNIRTGLIDPDTPESAMTRTGHKGQKQVLTVGTSTLDLRPRLMNLVLRRIQHPRPNLLRRGRCLLSSCRHLVRRDARSRGELARLISPGSKLTQSSGMIPMPSLRPTAPSTLDLKRLRITVWTIGRACFSRGINCVTKAVMWRQAFHCPVEAISLASGLVSGPWAT
jgi:hypothetical protein